MAYWKNAVSNSKKDLKSDSIENALKWRANENLIASQNSKQMILKMVLSNDPQ